MKKNKKYIFLLGILVIVLIIGRDKSLGKMGRQKESTASEDKIIREEESLDEIPSNISLRSKNVVMYDCDKNKIIYRKDIDKRMYPASMTKIMTAIIAIEEAENLDDKIVVPHTIVDDLRGSGAAISYLQPGEEISIRELLYGTLLSSSADSTLTLATYFSNSEEEFASKMNKKAVDIGMNNSNFTNSSGLHDENHYSTVEDMLKLLIYSLDNEEFEKIYTSREYVSHARKYESTVFTKLGDDGLSDQYIIGGKTGYTSEAGLCLASLGIVEAKRYIVVSSDADGKANSTPYHILDAIELYDSRSRSMNK